MKTWKATYENWQYRHQKLNSLSRTGKFITNATSGDTFALSRAFYYWKRMDYIECREKGNEIIIKITERGRNYLFRKKMKNSPELPNEKILLVLFDIPEAAKKMRRQLRYFLKIYGFKQLQLSAWYSKQDLRIALSEFIIYTELDKWTTFGIIEFCTMKKK